MCFKRDSLAIIQKDNTVRVLPLHGASKKNNTLLCYDYDKKTYVFKPFNDMLWFPNIFKMYTIKLENGATLTAGGSIELLTTKGFVRLKDITKDMLVHVYMYRCRQCGKLFYYKHIKKFCSKPCYRKPIDDGDLNDYLINLETIEKKGTEHNKQYMFKIDSLEEEPSFFERQEGVFLIPQFNTKIKNIVLNNFIVNPMFENYIIEETLIFKKDG